MDAQELQTLYQQLILDHARFPQNKGSVDGMAFTSYLKNPVCGDEVRLGFELKNGVVSTIAFEGSGCSISQAAISILTDLMRGKTVEELRELSLLYQELLQGEVAPCAKDPLGDLSAFESVKRFPLRIRCALLGCEALEQILKKVPAQKAA